MCDLQPLIDLCEREGISFRRDEPLAPHTTFHIGGAASLFCRCEDTGTLSKLICEANRNETPVFVLGRGSNVLFADEGFQGVVLQIGKGLGGICLVDESTIQCGSGAKLSALCEFAKRHSLSGLEFAFGIPGTVGGAIYMNAGAYGGEIKDVLAAARHLDRGGNVGTFQREQLDLSYRHSAYCCDEYIITEGTFRLAKGDSEEIAARMKEFMERRKDKQPLEYPSAGSTFKRPVGGYASALIDQCGLKGCRIGGAVVSEKHAGFVINDDGATARDVLALIEVVRDEVHRQTGIWLEPEVKLVGGRDGK